MKKLIRCAFCNQTIQLKELGYKDENGYWCKHCWEWLQTFLKTWGERNGV